MAGAAQLNSSLLTISVIAVLLPAAFHFAVNTNTDPDEGYDILRMSHGVAIILLIMYVFLSSAWKVWANFVPGSYGGYLFFQLWSHAHLYDEGEHSGEAMVSTAYPQNGKTLKGIAMGAIGRKPPTDAEASVPRVAEEEEVEEPKLNLVSAIGLLVVITVVRVLSIIISYLNGANLPNSLSLSLPSISLTRLTVLLPLAQLARNSLA